MFISYGKTSETLLLNHFPFCQVFKAQDSSAATHASQQSQKVAESILRFFPGFEAFMLPSPTVDPELLKSINDNKSKINPLFFRGLEGFKQLLRTVLVPKHSFNDGELVTGEGDENFYFDLIVQII